MPFISRYFVELSVIKFVHFVGGTGRQARPDVVVPRGDEARVRAQDSGRVRDLKVAEVLGWRNVGTKVAFGFEVAFFVVFVVAVGRNTILSNFKSQFFNGPCQFVYL